MIVLINSGVQGASVFVDRGGLIGIERFFDGRVRYLNVGQQFGGFELQLCGWGFGG